MDNDLINEMNSTLAVLELEFFNKVCKKCIGTPQQRKYKCRRIDNTEKLACKRKGNYLQRKIRPTSERLSSGLITNMVDNRLNTRKHRIRK